MFDPVQLQSRHQIFPCGVIHVGAHRGQEASLYDDVFRAGRVLWIEADPVIHLSLQASLAGRTSHTALQGLIAETDGQAKIFYRTFNDGESSSYLPLKDHLRIYPWITVTETIPLKTVTLPSLLTAHGVDANAYDYLVIDTQGTELSVVKGCGDMLSQFRWICCEVNQIELYEGCALFGDITAFLLRAGFELIDLAWTGHGWGEALYIRRAS